MTKMCDYVGKWSYRATVDEVRKADQEMENRGELGWEANAHPTVIRRRIVCPKCKRRMIADTKFGHDTELMIRVPPHKRKRWWKRKKQSRRRK